MAPRNALLRSLDPLQSLEIADAQDQADDAFDLANTGAQFAADTAGADFDRGVAELQTAFSRAFPNIGASHAARGLGSSGLVKGAQRRAIEDREMALARLKAGYDVQAFNAQQQASMAGLNHTNAMRPYALEAAFAALNNPYSQYPNVPYAGYGMELPLA